MLFSDNTNLTWYLYWFWFLALSFFKKKYYQKDMSVGHAFVCPVLTSYLILDKHNFELFRYMHKLVRADFREPVRNYVGGI